MPGGWKSKEQANSYTVSPPQHLGATKRLNPIAVGLSSLSVKVLGPENATRVWAPPISHPKVEWVEAPPPTPTKNDKELTLTKITKEAFLEPDALCAALP